MDASVANSRDKLGLNPLHTVCLHQWAKHGPSLHGGAAYTRLKQLKAKGVSVPAYTFNTCALNRVSERLSQTHMTDTDADTHSARA